MTAHAGDEFEACIGSNRRDVLVAGGYRKRSELSTTDRDFSSPSITENPQGGFSSFGNPGTFIIPGRCEGNLI